MAKNTSGQVAVSLDRSISAESLRERIKATRDAGERLDKLDYLKRLWLASYAADVDVIGDCLEELLDQGIQSVTPFQTQFARMASNKALSVDSETITSKDGAKDHATCNACGAALDAEVERTTRRLLASLDAERRAKLADTYQGRPPSVLCAQCFNAALSMVNGVR